MKSKLMISLLDSPITSGALRAKKGEIGGEIK